jgi:uncharacterized membrane protein
VTLPLLAEEAATNGVPETVSSTNAPVPLPVKEVVTNNGPDTASLTKDELLNQLKTQQSQLALDQARNEMERAKVSHEETQRLFDDKIVTIDQLNKARQEYEQAVLRHDQAKIELEKTRLEFLKGATLITVVNATKYRSPDGQVMVSVKLRNDSDIAKAWIAMGGTNQISREQLTSLLRVNNIIVRLREQAIIGDPYQQIIPELKLGADVTLEFRLLKRDVESITVEIEFLESQKEYTVFLMKEALQDLPTVTSTQYAQEGQLGSKVRYDLVLERLASTEQSFSLVVLNMPLSIAFAFVDPAGNARVTHLKFDEQHSNQKLQLEVAIPEKLDAKLVGASIDFSVIITRATELAAISALRQKHDKDVIPAEEMATIKGSRVGLKLIPTGAGKLDILVPNLFKEVKRGEPVSFKFTLLNSGTLTLRMVTPKLNLPTEWEGGAVPKMLDQIDPGEQAVITVNLRPPSDVAVGEYSVKLAADGRSGVENIDATEKNFTVRLAAPSNVTGTVVLVVVLVMLVLGIAVASIRISRR